MKFKKTRILTLFIYFIIASIALNLGCAKDSDILLDSVLKDSTDSDSKIIETNDDDTTTEDTPDDDDDDDEQTFESRTTSFSPTNDAHFQSGKGFDQNIIRLEENQRTSYLMFNLSPIDSINGTISKVTLQITIDSDDGSGNISVNKGATSEWTEEDLSETTAPATDVLIGEIIKEYNLGSTELIELTATELQPDITTLILSHKNGNDLAFASKEHRSKIGPKLVVTYIVPEDSEEIKVVDDDDDDDETVENEAPIAVADATPSSGGAPLKVSFKGSNSSDDSNIVSYTWNFKDGTSDSSPDPTHTYTTLGVYEAELTVKDDEGLSTTDFVTITVTDEQNEAPIAKIIATPLIGEAPLEVTFNGSESTDDHSISSYTWNFKDGNSSSTANIKHTYTEAGSYEVELTVKDENGLLNKETITIEVNEPTNSAPVAKTSANKTHGSAPLTVQFTGTDSTDDKEITGYSWDFKNGSNSTNSNPTYTFENAGSYVVELTVKDAEGLTHKNTITITVTEPIAENEAPIAVATSNKTTGEAPLNIQFTGSNSTDDNEITSYTWDFKDGSTSTSSNPSHTFTNAGSYDVALTVKDADGASNTKNINISVSTPTVNVPVDYYVTTSGSASNNGKTETSAWSLEHAFSAAESGDIIYIKAGNYGNKQVILYQSGNSGNPIKFIGYTGTPGDLVTNQGSSFTYGQSINPNKMPLLSGASNTQGTAIDLNGSYIELHNIQITNYKAGVFSKGKNVLLKNIINTNNGTQSSNSQQDGKGFQIYGDYTIVEDCFVLNSNSEGINFKGASNGKIHYSSVYSDNIANPTGYYILMSNGAKNNVVEHCKIYRNKNANIHKGHGYVLKDQATNNTIRNSIAYDLGIEVNFSGVYSNTFDSIDISGSYFSDNSEHSSNIRVLNGAHDNIFKNINVQDALQVIGFVDLDDGYVGSGDDRDEVEGGHNNKFINITSSKTQSIIIATSTSGASAFSNNNEFTNCSFSDVRGVPFVSYQDMNNTQFINSTFNNIPSNIMSKNFNQGSFPISFQNCTFTNIGFTNP